MDKRCAILLVSVTILVLCFVGTASATNWSVDGSGGADFIRIQDAINKASDGDRIIVHSGVYHENVIVDKSVTLKGVGQPVVDANCSGSAISLTEDRITLVGFNATNSGSGRGDVGINVTSNNNTITGNNVSSNNYGIRLDNSSNNNSITGNNVSNNNYDGIRLYDSSNNNSITGNNVSNNNYGGIRLWDSSNNNIITGNNVSNNNYDGIRLYDSSNNKIYFNNFINNKDMAYSYKSTNIWNSPLEITYTYDGTTYESYLGNYWDDYEGTDAEGDGIGDTHYSIYSKSDDYPLMKPFGNYTLTKSAPA